MTDIKLRNYHMHTCGNCFQLGESLPQVTVTNTDMQPVALSQFANQSLIIYTFPSLDTAVHYESVMALQKMMASYQNITALTISMDLPFSLKRMAAESRLSYLHCLSDFRTREFGIASGLLIEDGLLAGLLASSVIITDKSHNVTFVEVEEQVDEVLDLEKVSQYLKHF